MHTSGTPVTSVLQRALSRSYATASKPDRHEVQLDVSGLGSGTYFLRLQDGTETITQKVTIVR